MFYPRRTENKYHKYHKYPRCIRTLVSLYTNFNLDDKPP